MQGRWKESENFLNAYLAANLGLGPWWSALTGRLASFLKSARLPAD